VAPLQHKDAFLEPEEEEGEAEKNAESLPGRVVFSQLAKNHFKMVKFWFLFYFKRLSSCQLFKKLKNRQISLLGSSM
jgi:hypothetical protein